MKNQGFTLIELMVTIAVAAIVAGLAVPSFITFIQNNRLVAQNNALITSLNIARSESTKRHETLTVCASSDGASCNTTQWELGWLVFVDLDSDATPDVGTSACLPTEDCIIQTSDELQGGNTLRSSGFTSAGSVQYNTRGAPDSTGTFTLCDSRGAGEAHAANLNLIGRVSQAVDGDGNSIIENLQGNDVSCP